MRKLVRKSYTPVVPIANTCSIGCPHDGRADNAAYRHDRRADNAAYRHDRRADSLSRALILSLRMARTRWLKRGVSMKAESQIQNMAHLQTVLSTLGTKNARAKFF